MAAVLRSHLSSPRGTSSFFHPESPKKKKKAPSFLIVASVLFVFASSSFSQPLKIANSSSSTAPQISEEEISDRTQKPALSPKNLLSSLPARFEQNKGQIDPYFSYLAKTNDFQAAIAKGRIVFSLKEPYLNLETSAPEEQKAPLGHLRDDPLDPSQRDATIRYISMSFEGANPDPELLPERPQPGLSNYFRGSDPALWRTKIEGYSALRIKQIYPGIDLLLEDKQGKIAYSFYLFPGADPAEIKLVFEGDVPIYLSEEGELVLGTDRAKLIHTPPYAYQEKGGKRVEVASLFSIKEPNKVGFSLGDYDPSLPLVIDPTLTYSTYLGGTANDVGNSLAVDDTGAVYVTGHTLNADFPTTQGAYQTSYNGMSDAFVTKLSSDGSSLVWSTFLGGTGIDIGLSLALQRIRWFSGPFFGVTLTGQTSSSDFPTNPEAYDTSSNGSYDAFVTKLATTDGSLGWSTYLGGTYDEIGYSIALDSQGVVYVAGGTSSSNFPTTQGAYQTSYNGGVSDVFVTKLSSDGSSLVWSTFLGGTGDERGYSSAVDSQGAVYVTGWTSSSDFPTNPEAYDTSYNGNFDVFLTKVYPDGSRLAWSTFLGGMGNDIGYSLAVDSQFAVYVKGWTSSSDFPTTSGAYDTSYNGGLSDVFLTKVYQDGTSLVWSTFLGGTANDVGYSLAVDSQGAVYVTGWTWSSGFPTTAGAYDTSHNGGSDAFLTKLSSDGSSLVWSTFLGGTGDDVGWSLAVDSQGAVYVTGETSSSGFPTTGGAYDTSHNGGSDAFLTKLANITGTVTGGTGGSISVYSAATGQLVEYYCCMTSENFSVVVPASSCPSGGYKILWLPPDQTKAATWYNQKKNFSQADCVSSPGSLSWSAFSAGEISGAIKKASDNSPIDQAIIYAYDAATGTFAGWAKSGASGIPGAYSLTLSPGTYKLKVVPPSGFVGEWYQDVYSFPAASSLSTPQSGIDFLLDSSAAIEGFVREFSRSSPPLNSVPVYAYRTDGSFFGYALTNRGYGQGYYHLEAPPGTPLKLLAYGGTTHYSQWWNLASSFTEANTIEAPATANFSLDPR